MITAHFSYHRIWILLCLSISIFWDSVLLILIQRSLKKYWIFSCVLLHWLHNPGQNKERHHPVFSYMPYSVFYILPSNPIVFLMLMIPGFANLLDRRSSASWLNLPLSWNILAEVISPQHFLHSWLSVDKKLSPSAIPCLTLSLLTEMVVKTLSNIRPGYI